MQQQPSLGTAIHTILHLLGLYLAGLKTQLSPRRWLIFKLRKNLYFYNRSRDYKEPASRDFYFRNAAAAAAAATAGGTDIFLRSAGVDSADLNK